MSIAEEIQKLDQLRQSGALSEGEFEAAKARVLSGSGTRSGAIDSVDRVLDSFGLGSGTDATERAGNYSMWLHISMYAGFFAPGLGFVLPIVLWQIKKDDPIIDEHGRNVVNFLISQLIYLIVSGFLTFFIVGFFLIAGIVIMSLICPLLVGLKAKQGIIEKYPLTIKFI